HAVGRARSFFGRQLSLDVDLRTRGYTLHYFLDHSAIDDGSFAAIEKAAGRRRDGPSEDQSVDALSHRRPGRIADFIRSTLAANQRCGPADMGFFGDDRINADDWNDLRNVAGRAN